MKCSVFLFSFIVCLFSFVPVSSAEELKYVEIQSVSYSIAADKTENITFRFSGHIVPYIFRLQGEKPRIVIDFPMATYKGRNRISADSGMLALGIRMGTHVTPVIKTRAVVDLSSAYEIKYAQSFADRDNTLTIVLSSSDPDKDAPPVPVLEEPSGEKVAELIEPAGGPRLLGISFDDSSNKGEMVIFRLNDFYPPKVSAIEKDIPQVLCDFMDMQLGADVDEVIVANGTYVEHIRVVRHENQDKVRVVLDLSPDRDYDLQQVFFKNDNLFVLIVNELSEKELKNNQ